MNRLLIASAFALLVIGGAAVARAQKADARKVSELIVDIDVNDEVWLRDHNMTEADVKELAAKLKANGCQTLLIRCGCIGFLPYRTARSYPAGYDPQHARASPAPDIIKDVEAEIVTETAWMKRYGEVIADFNPPAAFIAAGHEQGMKVICWLDIFDDGWPGFHSKFIDEHPYCQWVGKDGKTYFHGLIDYSWPEARAFRVAQARELLALGADGIHCSTSAHCRHMPNVHDIDFYGYSQPTVDAFKAKYGVDIRTATDFDKEAWHDLKGQAMVELYRSLAQLCHEQKKELWVGLQLGQHTQFASDTHFSTNVVARYTNHWRTLVDERIADAFNLGDYEPGDSPGMGYWTAKPDIKRAEGEDLYGWAAREYQAYCKGKTRLYLFSGWLSPPVGPRLDRFAEVLPKYGFDGIDVHEAWDFEGNPANMPLLGAFAKRLRGEE
ncbi:MAG TPA: hypothetical protein VHY91_14860 [Pirellulales bacterium]|jgi:hypothetical protein|nr:hypothetical protein [Pirellulales bacterium]